MHFVFSDINECQESSPCNQHCLNTIGSYRCACEPGFQLRNRRCIGEAKRIIYTNILNILTEIITALYILP